MSTELMSIKSKPRKTCKNGYILNPLTNMCVKETGAIGKKLLAAHSKAEADAIAAKIPREILLVIANMLPVEHRHVFRLVDKQFAADIAPYEPSNFAIQNSIFLMHEITQSIYYSLKIDMRVSRSQSTSKQNTLLVRTSTDPDSLIDIIRYYDSKHSTILAKYTEYQLDAPWLYVFDDTSPTDMVWLADMMETMLKVTNTVSQDRWNDWLRTRRLD
jgi:hypothetical protein